MKARFFALMALVLGIVSCQTEPEGLNVNVGGEVDAVITVNIPEADTRARTAGSNSAEGAFANGVLGTESDNTTMRYILQIYNEAGTASNERLVEYSDGKSVSFNVRLVPGRDYQFVVWADVVADGKNDTDNHYNTSDLKNITLKDGKWKAMDESRDAFTATTLVEEYTGQQGIDITLYRPFSKLRIVTTDTEAVDNLGIKPTTATVTYETAHRVAFNAYTGKAEAASLNNMEHKDYEIASYGEAFPGEEYTLFTDYFFAGDELEPVKFNFKSYDANGVVIKEVSFTNDIPVKRNNLTTIVGNFLTTGDVVNVKIEDAFENGSDWNPEDDKYDVDLWDGESISAPMKNAEGHYIIKTPSELAWLAAAVNGTLTEDYTRATVDANDFSGKTFILSQNIDLGNESWTPIGSNGKIFKGTFDGNNKKIANLVVDGYNSNAGLFGHTTDGEIKNFTLENAKVSGRTNVGAVAGQPYTSKYTNITVQGHVEINGMAYVGGVGGKNAYADWTNITVNVDETSYVKANSIENGTAYRTYVGGVVGFNGEGGHSFKNITSNINVIGSTCDVGGLFGIAHYGNQFENCTCSGNVTITTDDAENALEMGGLAGVWNNGGQDVVFTYCSFTGELLTPNITEEVDFYYNGLIGAPYSATGTGKLIVDNTIYAHDAASLQAALDAAPENATTVISLGANIEGNVTDIQKQGRKVMIDGHDYKYNGTIKVHSNSNYQADAALTIKNLNFETSKASVNFIEALENGSERYSCNITVEDCTFTATGEAVNTAVGVQIKASKNAKVIRCTATNVHSLIQAQSCDESVLVQNCTVVNGKNGVAFKQVKNAVVEGTTITATAYGIRFDGNIDNYGITVKDNNVTALQPFIVRRMTGQNNTIALEGTNTLTTGEKYQIIITNDSDDEEYVAPTGTYTLTGADNFRVYPAIEDYDAFLEKISDDTWYDDTKTELAIEDVADFAAFVETANSGNDFEGKTLKLTGDIDLYFEDITALADGDPITFRPIGDTKYNGDKPFKGTFDGQGHTIKNLYQNGWDLGYQWGVYGSYGLFGSLENATVKNVVIEGSESYIEGGDVSFIAGSATGNCVFENITINSGVAATYNNGCGGIIGWSGAGNYTFKNITIGEDVVLGGLWGSFDSSIGGIVGQAEPGATYNFENVTINCRIDAYNDCTASYDYYNYRMCGMIIGRCEETTTIDGANYPDLSKYNLSFNNVVVNYGKWMNYHYCQPTPGHNGGRGMRTEPGYAYDGLPEDYDHSQCVDDHYRCIPFDQLIGGDQYGVKGLREVDGVTVNYPAEYTCPLCGQQHNVE